jgi:hypothetical protein
MAVPECSDFNISSLSGAPDPFGLDLEIYLLLSLLMLSDCRQCYHMVSSLLPEISFAAYMILPPLEMNTLHPQGKIRLRKLFYNVLK